jgi:hypothetical protein
LDPISDFSALPITSDGTAEASSTLTNSVERVLFSEDGLSSLLQLSQTTSQHRRRQEFLIIHVAELDTADLAEEKVITAITLPQELQDYIDRPLSFVGAEYTTTLRERRGFSASSNGDHLAFLDKEAWVCTISLGDMEKGGKVKRHFFLPQDWLNTEYMELAQVTRQGVFLCPKNGEVGLVHNGLRRVWGE